MDRKIRVSSFWTGCCLAAACATFATAQRAQIPEFVHGDECLFCHRKDIGNDWQKNRHGVALRQKEDVPGVAAPAAATHVLGSRKVVRFLKKDGYGKFQITDAADPAKWDKNKFGARCAGCHTTAVETATQTFQEIGLDCYTCHGAVDLNHSADTSLVLLSKKRRSDVKMITSICAQCHLRGATSKSTGLPYANQFVAGDDLFADLKVDWSLAESAELNAGDRHIYRNVRDVVQNGSQASCLTCHRVHGGGSRKHRLVAKDDTCLDCHNAEGPKKATKPYTVTSALCEY